jgi:epoxyqueuosine reductase
MGDRIYGCDECQEVCPVGRPERTSEGNSDPTADLDALGILNATDQELLDNYGRWYIAERDPKYLRRNALVVLGNAQGENAQIDRCLEYYLDHYDPLLHEHAKWAINQRASL